MELRLYQHAIAMEAALTIKELNFVYIAAEVRTGKTLMALQTAYLGGFKKVLFVTKIKAFSSIENDYTNFHFNDKFEICITNAESLHKCEFKPDCVISDEHHKYQAYPKPSEGAKTFRQMFGHLPIIALSGTMHPESYAQIYHQFWVSNYGPFSEPNFYKWHNNYGTKKLKYVSYGTVNDYSVINYDLLKPIIDPYIITFTQAEAGFETTVNEHILKVKLKPQTYTLINRLKKDLVIQGKEEVILADTGVKLMSKLHQLYSGTVKFESGNSMVLDHSKAEFIKQHFAGKKIAIFYKFKEELNMLENIFGENICNDLETFNTSNKNIACQLLSFREGVSLKNAKYLVYLNIDFSNVTYIQSRDRMTTMGRLNNEIYWIFAENGIESYIYKTVQNKKKYTENIFKKDFGIK